MMLKFEIDGEVPGEELLRELALDAYGHFTAMQVRGGRTRGLGLHLERLDTANRELFGEPLDGERVRELIRHALHGLAGDHSVRVLVRGAGEGAGMRVIVTVRPPYEMPETPQRLKAVRYQRAVAHIKRPGDFGQAYFGRLAQQEGFDGALLVADDGTIAEGDITNIAFLDGSGVLWPSAPALAGITMRLVGPRMEAYGLPSRSGRITVEDLPGIAGACLTNSRGVAPVASIDDVKLPLPPDFFGAMHSAYESVPWDEI